MTTVSSLVIFSHKYAGIVFTFSPKVKEVIKDELLKKGPYSLVPLMEQLAGSHVTETIGFPWNALLLMLVTVLGIVIFVRLHPQKAYDPMVVTPSGRLTFPNLLQP